MSVTRTFRGGSYAPDHFEPDASMDPQAQRRLRGQLEQIDYAAFAANRDLLARGFGHTDVDQFQRLALATAGARARWVAEAMAISTAASPTPAQIAKLAEFRIAFEELSHAYEGLRRMVERGYIGLRAPAPG
jgi:hypothetical protein